MTVLRCARAADNTERMISDSLIIGHVARQPKKIATYKQLLRELGLKGDDRRELAERLRVLVKRGELQEIDPGRYSMPKAAANRNMLVGRLTMHRDGFGFVIPSYRRRYFSLWTARQLRDSH